MPSCFPIASSVRLLVHLAVLAGLSCATVPAQTTRGDAAITGVVRSYEGESAAAGVKITAQNASSAKPIETRTLSDGTFALNSLPAGSYKIKIETSENELIEQEVTLSAGEHRQLVFTFRSGERRSQHAPAAPSDIQFQDKPSFTIAGISDWTAAGGHGSDANLRTSENLAKETAELKQSAESPARTPDQLRQARKQAEKLIASNHSADGYRQLGDIDEQLGDSLSAVREYEKAAQMDPSEQNYFSWGSELLLHRAIQPAVDVFARGARKHPMSARMLSGWGAALYASGQYAQAAQHLCEASDLQPTESAAYVFLGKMQKAATESLPCAEDKLARFAANQPNNALANYYYAVSILRQLEGPKSNSDDRRRAEVLLERAVNDDPKLAEPLVELGALRFWSGHFTEAIDFYERAVEANPNLAEAHFRLGMAYKKTGEQEKARREFQLYEQLSKGQAEQIERQRRELKQFVVTLKEQAVSH